MQRAKKILLLAIALSAVSWSYSYASHAASTTVREADSTTLRDPNYAIFVALVPGAVVHGAGHFYARKVGTGFIVLGCELTGAALVYLGTVTGVESGEPSPGGTVAIATGTILFLGSWAYDAVFAPLSIKKENERRLGGKSSRLELRLKNGGVRLVTVFRF